MKDEDFAFSRILELESRSEYGETIEASYFFSYSELRRLLSKLPKKIRESAFLFGGFDEAECKCFFFLPSYLDKETFLKDKLYEGYIGCYLIETTNPAYAKPLSHPSVLGTLMGLGIKRETIGDIYVEPNKAIFFALKSIEKEILSVEKVGRDAVTVSKILYEESPIKPRFETLRITYESNRLDSIVSEAFRISREEAKRQIGAGNVYVTNLLSPRPDSVVHPGDHISVKGKGKVIFMEEEGTSRKGKTVASIRKPL
ncbi:MAG: hypothetical protein K6B65_03265 [Bacilli bacterium]|nr:hypothetical protein [Bacilli bacterium]